MKVLHSAPFPLQRPAALPSVWQRALAREGAFERKQEDACARQCVAAVKATPSSSNQWQKGSAAPQW